jgi:hypothetical protein
MLGVGQPANYSLVSAQTFGRAVALRGLWNVPINLNEHGVVNIAIECYIDR